MGSLGTTLATTGNTTDAVASGAASSVAVEDNRLFLRGNDGQKEQLLAILQELSDKKLVVDGRGEVLVDKEYLDKIFSSLDPNSDKYIDTLLELRVLLAEEHPIGTKLVDKLIEDRRRVDIRLTTSDRGINNSRGYLSGGQYGVNLNVVDPVSALTDSIDENGENARQPIPTPMVLGHEMIHVWNIMTGQFDSDPVTSYTNLVGELITPRDPIQIDELNTVGIPVRGGRIGEFTEDALRAEHNLNLRIQY